MPLAHRVAPVLVTALLAGCVWGPTQVEPEQWNEVTYVGGVRDRLDELIAGKDPAGKQMYSSYITESFAEHRQRVLQKWFDERLQKEIAHASLKEGDSRAGLHGLPRKRSI